MSFTHIVTFKWRDGDVTDQPIAEALNTLVPALDGVQNYICGADIGLTPATYDFAVVGIFDSREHFLGCRSLRHEHGNLSQGRLLLRELVRAGF